MSMGPDQSSKCSLNSQLLPAFVRFGAASPEDSGDFVKSRFFR